MDKNTQRDIDRIKSYMSDALKNVREGNRVEAFDLRNLAERHTKDFARKLAHNGIKDAPVFLRDHPQLATHFQEGYKAYLEEKANAVFSSSLAVREADKGAPLTSSEKEDMRSSNYDLIVTSEMPDLSEFIRPTATASDYLDSSY